MWIAGLDPNAGEPAESETRVYLTHTYVAIRNINRLGLSTYYDSRNMSLCTFKIHFAKLKIQYRKNYEK